MEMLHNGLVRLSLMEDHVHLLKVLVDALLSDVRTMFSIPSALRGDNREVGKGCTVMVHPLPAQEGSGAMASGRRELVTIEDQAEVPFYGTSILAVKLSGGRVAAVFSSLCAALDLARQPQLTM